MKLIPLKEIDVGKVSFRFWQKVQPQGSCLNWCGGCIAHAKSGINWKHLNAVS